MRRRAKDALAWGAVGALAFLVLAQGYRLATGDGVPFLALLGVAAVVFAASTVLAYALTDRLH